MATFVLIPGAGGVVWYWRRVVFDEGCRFEAWPQVSIRATAGRDDRFFPTEFQRRVTRERLGVEVDELAGGHLLASRTRAAWAISSSAILENDPSVY